MGSGLNRLNRKTGDFDRINSTNSGICNDYITSIYRDKEKNLWITTTLGLSRYDKNLKSFTCQQNRPDDLKSIIDNEVTTSLEDSRGFFWVGTNNGLNILNYSNNSFRHFTTADGLPSNSIHGIVEDKNKNLWISSKNGISRIELKNIQNTDHFDFKSTN